MKKAKEILEAIKEVYPNFNEPSDEGLAALKRIVLSRKIDNILGVEKCLGVSFRELDNETLQLVHSQAHLHCQKTAANAVNIKITPYDTH